VINTATIIHQPLRADLVDDPRGPYLPDIIGSLVCFGASGDPR
jgi:hypothetical protein